jgi:hypothetical protein
MRSSLCSLAVGPWAYTRTLRQYGSTKSTFKNTPFRVFLSLFLILLFAVACCSHSNFRSITLSGSQASSFIVSFLVLFLFCSVPAFIHAHELE